MKDVDVIDNHDNTYTVKYTPVQQVSTWSPQAAPQPLVSPQGITLTILTLGIPQGPVGVSITYGGDPIPKSPFSVGVSPSLDLSKIKVSGLGESK